MEQIKIVDKNIFLSCIIALAILMLIPFIGMTDFHTKGEPREAVIALDMLKSGNWILPVTAGGDIAYKPPFYHWCVAATSYVCGGVTEFTARFPSSAFAIAMIIMFYLFYARRTSSYQSFLATAILMTSFEVHRAAMNARVDMVLMSLSVMAILKLYMWWEKGLKGIPIIAILLMSAAFLTKGPVGFLLPCASCGLFLLLKKMNFFKALWKLGYVGALSCVIPFIWYFFAYRQGGQEFLDLVLEENIGRFSGGMSYESHEQPVYYNFITLFAGFTPWNLLLIISLFILPYKSFKSYFSKFGANIKNSYNSMSSVELFTLVIIFIYIVFYSVPKSKRSVYILPLYPFVAYYVAKYVNWFNEKNLKPANIFGWIISSISIAIIGILLAIKLIGLRVDHFFKPKTAKMIDIYTDALNNVSWNIIQILCLIILISGIIIFIRSKRSVLPQYRLYIIVFLIVSLQMFMDGVIQPAILNTKSTKDFAHQVIDIVPNDNIYGYINVDMLRFYIVNFYTGDRVKIFDKESPENGYVLVGDRTFENDFIKKYGETYTFEPVLKTRHSQTELRDYITLYKFDLK